MHNFRIPTLVDGAEADDDGEDVAVAAAVHLSSASGGSTGGESAIAESLRSIPGI